MKRFFALLLTLAALPLALPAAQQTISIGTAANDGTGDTLRAAFGKANANFGELYARPVGSGTVTTITLTAANGVSATITNPTTTPAITITLGAITPSSVAATGNVTGANLSGSNTGDQTTITGNAGTATALQTARTINGVAFDGTVSITVPAAAGTLTGTALAANVTSSSLLSAAGGSFGSAAFANTGTAAGNVAVLGTGGAHTFLDGVVHKASTGQLLFGTSSNILYLYTGASGVRINNQGNTATLLELSNAGALSLGGTVAASSVNITAATNPALNYGGTLYLTRTAAGTVAVGTTQGAANGVLQAASASFSGGVTIGGVAVPTTAAGGGIVLAADQSVTSSTTLIDTPLTTTLGPGTWLIEVQCTFRNAGATSGAKIAIATSGATFLSGRRWYRDTAGGTISFLHDQASGASPQSAEDVGGGGLAGFSNTYSVGTSAVVTVQWAQNVSDASAANMKTGSYLTWRKVGN